MSESKLMRKLLTNPALLPFSIVLGCTAVNGATTHLPAFALRAGVIATIFALWPKKDHPFNLGQVVTPFLAILALMQGNLLALAPGLAIQPTVTTIACIGLFFALIHREEDPIPALFNALIGVGVVHSLWALIEFGGSMTRSSGGFFNPNNLAAFLSPLCLVALHRVIHQPRRQRLVWALITLILLLGLIVTYSRSGVITLGVAASIFLIGRFRMRALLPITALGLALGGVVWWRQFGQSFDPYSFSRINIWRESFFLALKNPFGVGLGGYGIAIQHQGVPLEGMVRYPKIAHKAHSELFQVWVELGWLGLFALVSGPATILIALKRHLKQGTPVAFDGAMLLAFSLPALAFTTMHVPIIAITATLWAASVIRSTPNFGPLLPFSTGRGKLSGIGATCAFALLLALPGAIAEYFGEKAGQYSSENNTPAALKSATLSSQFAPWSVGKHLLKESLLFKKERNPLESSKRLAELADRFPHDSRPIQRALLLLHSIDTIPPHTRRSMEVSLLKELIRRSPTDAFPHLKLANVHLRRSESEHAFQSVKSCLNIEPNFASCLSLQAEFLYNSGKISRASHFANLATKANQESKKKHSGRSKIILQLPPEKEKIIQQIVSESP